MNNEVVVITGASAGVGRATARAFARRGARIGLLARGRDGLDATRRELEDMGAEALALPTDVADADQVERAAEEVERAFGPIDVWINNAMVTVYSPILEMKPAEYRRVTEVTYLGYVHGTLSALRRMHPRDRGVIVQVGSGLAHRGIPLQSAYCAAKHAIKGFTDSLLAELHHDESHVRVAMVDLPAINTPQFDWARSRMPRRPQPVPPILQPEVAAEAILSAIDQRRARSWLDFSTAKLILADRVVPASLLDRYLAKNAYDGQQSDEPAEPHARDNLDSPVPGDHGARGRFDASARRRSAQLWMSQHRAGLAAMVLGVGLLGGLVAMRIRANGWA
ncbi:SDR family oxidoreductase [Polyangium spumosum]|uniref:SDR family NAD(P)-dependent oxidoreductase n=1 Tax=Polyangium spumosum TaxID=889282 RepID=A0A6N7Q1Z1_9BACT|nr:SDR family oxidoreductase [Polyangium spumosum]MRG96625.1 SDR family NAD(P)-dependent oxidoreductase [Polyangium spumosum]